MVQQEALARILEGFLLKSVETGKKIREDSEEAKRLIEKLEKTTKFQSILEQESRSERQFIEESHAFSNAVLKWTQNYPDLVNEFKQVLSILINDLKSIGFITTKTFPTFSIDFNQKKFEYYLRQTGEDVHNLEIQDIGQQRELEKKENKLVQEIAEIVSLDFHLENFLLKIQGTIESQNISDKCNYVISQNNLDGKIIENLHIIIVWWNNTKNSLLAIKKNIFTAVELDRDAAKKLQKMAKQGLKQKQMNVLFNGLKILGKISLDLIPGGNIISTGLTLYEERGLYHEALRALKEED